LFARRWGKSEESARDSTQSFFLSLIQHELLKQVDPARGHLRTYLLALFKRRLSHEHRDANRLKRGGGVVHVSLHDIEYATVGTTETAEDIYHRNWALSLLKTALDQVELDWKKRGKATIFAELRPHLLEEATQDLTETARILQTPAVTVRSWLHRLRLAYQAALSAAVAATLIDTSTEAVQTELNELSRYFS
jgi:DNA-directed RNA polymerase specialized sigma24 family protein